MPYRTTLSTKIPPINHSYSPFIRRQRIFPDVDHPKKCCFRGPSRKFYCETSLVAVFRILWVISFSTQKRLRHLSCLPCSRITLKCCSHLLPCIHTPRSRSKLDVIPRLNISRSDQLGLAVSLEMVARSHLSLTFLRFFMGFGIRPPCFLFKSPAHKRYRSRRITKENWIMRRCKMIQDVGQVSYPSHNPCAHGEVIKP
jgi:hypothetical protein